MGLRLEKFYPSSYTTPLTQQFRILPSRGEIEASSWPSTKRWAFHHSIELLMSAEYSSETHWHMRRVTSRNNDYHEYRTPQSQWQQSHTIDPDEIKMTSVTSNGCNQQPYTGEHATTPLNASIHGGNLQRSETKWRTRRLTDIDDDDHKYRT